MHLTVKVKYASARTRAVARIDGKLLPPVLDVDLHRELGPEWPTGPMGERIRPRELRGWDLEITGKRGWKLDLAADYRPTDLSGPRFSRGHGRQRNEWYFDAMVIATGFSPGFDERDLLRADRDARRAFRLSRFEELIRETV